MLLAPLHFRRRNSSRLRCRKHLADGAASNVERDREADRGTAGNGMVRPCSCPVSDRSWQGAPKTRSTLCPTLHRNVLAIALANKLARIAWGVLARGRAFEASKLQAA